MSDINGLNLPYEDVPEVFEAMGSEVGLEDAIVTGGVVIKATVIEIPEIGWRPALVYQFYTGDGKPLKPIVFVTTEYSTFSAVKALTSQGANAAIKECRKRINGE